MGYILASKTYTEDGDTFRIIVEGGLHYIKGNKKPYFTITGNKLIKKRNNRFYDYSSGCIHEDIKKAFNGEFDDLIALHLSDIDGIPLHCGENGAYWLGFSKYQGLDLEKASNHFRVSEKELREKLASLITAEDVKEWAKTLEPKFKTESLECIKKHDLKIFGDKWEV